MMSLEVRNQKQFISPQTRHQKDLLNQTNTVEVQFHQPEKLVIKSKKKKIILDPLPKQKIVDEPVSAVTSPKE